MLVSKLSKEELLKEYEKLDKKHKEVLKGIKEKDDLIHEQHRDIQELQKAQNSNIDLFNQTLKEYKLDSVKIEQTKNSWISVALKSKELNDVLLSALLDHEREIVEEKPQEKEDNPKED